MGKLSHDDNSKPTPAERLTLNRTILISAVDENGAFETAKLSYGDIWYFPKGNHIVPLLFLC